jgi:hypothetical protein
MKRFSILSAVIAVILMVAAVSCTPIRETGDDYYYDRAQAPSRIYVDDPYRGTVVLERDPYSGRYYEVGPYSSYYSPYAYRSNPYYGYHGRSYANRNRIYNRNTTTYPSTSPQQKEEQRRDWEQKREEARDKVLGGKSR